MKGHMVTEGKVDKKPIEDDVSEVEAPQRRYPIRNRCQTSFFGAAQGVSKAKTQTF